MTKSTGSTYADTLQALKVRMWFMLRSVLPAGKMAGYCFTHALKSTIKKGTMQKLTRSTYVETLQALKDVVKKDTARCDWSTLITWTNHLGYHHAIDTKIAYRHYKRGELCKIP